MNGDRHRELRELLGAYVLDQLGERERGTVEAHVSDCRACQAELNDLRPIAAALRGVDPTLGVEPAPPEDLGERVVHHIHTRRRTATRRRWVRRATSGVLVAASVAAAFGAGAWWAGPRTDPPVVAVTLQRVAPGVQADAGLVKHTWGTELKLRASGLTDGASYTVTFVRDDGAEVAAGSFLGTGDRPVVCSVNAALPIDDASEFTVTDAAGIVVLDALV